MIDPEWRGFRRAPDGILCWNGWAVFGHILPRIGIFEAPCYRTGEMIGVLGDGQEQAPYCKTVLMLEWLGRGVMVSPPWSRPRSCGPA